MTGAHEKPIRAPGEIARRYARAFYDYLTDQDTVPATLKQVHALRDALAGHSDLSAMLADPRFDSRRAVECMSAVSDRLHLCEEIKRFLGVIARHGRLSRLEEILEAVLLLDAYRREEVAVEITSAQPLTEAQRKRLHQNLKEAGYASTVMTERLNPALIGGMTVRIGSVLFDTSIAGRLTRLQNAMKGAA